MNIQQMQDLKESLDELKRVTAVLQGAVFRLDIRLTSLEQLSEKQALAQSTPRPILGRPRQ